MVILWYLLAAGELDGLHLLRPVLVVPEVVLDGEGLEQLHRCLAPHLRTGRKLVNQSGRGGGGECNGPIRKGGDHYRPIRAQEGLLDYPKDYIET